MWQHIPSGLTTGPRPYRPAGVRTPDTDLDRIAERQGGDPRPVRGERAPREVAISHWQTRHLPAGGDVEQARLRVRARCGAFVLVHTEMTTDVPAVRLTRQRLAVRGERDSVRLRSPPAEGPGRPAGSHVEQGNLAILLPPVAGRCQHPPIGRERKCHAAREARAHHLHRPSGGRLPQVHPTEAVAGREQPAVGREGHLPDVPAQPLPDVQEDGPLAPEVPQTEAPRPLGDGQPAAVRRDR